MSAVWGERGQREVPAARSPSNALGRTEIDVVPSAMCELVMKDGRVLRFARSIEPAHSLKILEAMAASLIPRDLRRA
ncbi:MAG: hypothetical protein Q8Q09_11190 [Deltaproteobacteria bacterium]|nr:hypothetical protein [Deltaproteobacteria bacterium]